MHGMANVEDPDPDEDVWYRKPWLLAGGAIALTVILSVIFA